LTFSPRVGRHVFVTPGAAWSAFSPNFLSRGKERDPRPDVELGSSCRRDAAGEAAMKVGDLTNEQLKRSIIGRLTSGELDLLMREAGRRGLDIDLTYEEYHGAKQEKALVIRSRITFQPMLAGIAR
jgi:hypothetical protein